MFGALLALLMATIALIDARHFIIPNALTGTALLLGLANAAVQSPDAVLEAIGFAVLRATALALLFLGGRALYQRLRGWEGLGLGDVKLAAVTGVWLDWLIIPFAIEIAALSALSYYVLQKLVGNRPMRATTRLPFGLFFAPSLWVGWLLQVILSRL